MSNSTEQVKCLKCGSPMNEFTCPNCGFDVRRDSLLSFERNLKTNDFYNNEFVGSNEHKEVTHNDLFKWIKNVAENGDTDVQCILGYMYEKGLRVKADKNKSIKWYQKAAELGHKEAIEKLSNLSISKKSKADEYYQTGLKHYEAKNYNEAYKWFKLAADQGYAKAQCDLGNMYYLGEGVTQDLEVAAKYYKLSAEQGYADAQFVLGVMYYHGQSVDQDYKEAAKWYKLAAKQGHARGQNDLGNMYYSGKGVERDYDEAAKWYKLAAEQGYVTAQNNLGNMYFFGRGVSKSYGKALKWYTLAAKSGYAVAQNNLGNMYYYGDGVVQNNEEAIKWYQKAANQGHKEAIEKLSKLTTKTNSKTENTGLKYSEDKIFFGSYYQNNQYKKEPIEWQILEKKGNKALLISKYALDCKRYNELFDGITWEKCTLRTWLNKAFLEQAFTPEEQLIIADTTVTADANPKFSMNPGNDTLDKVFILSIPEVNRYFNSDSDRQCQGTQSCFAQGAFQLDGKVWWWLRSPGSCYLDAARVDFHGSVDYSGNEVFRDRNAVRPALWVNLES